MRLSSFMILAASVGLASSVWAMAPPHLRSIAQSFVAKLTTVQAPAAPRSPHVVSAWSAELIAQAQAQIGVTLTYDGSYQALSYPDGDIPRARGVCTDVVIRALRDAHGIDLQKRVHEDMKRAFSSYPNNWNLSRPDKNIDHRRVPNLRAYFKRQGAALEVSTDPAAYLPGDIVTWTLGPGLPHIGIVSDQMTPDAARPLILHNVGAGTRKEDFLFRYPITGHYRVEQKI
ncbi:MAG: DUF1287 domain-containing protein [Thalassovita sp.]